MMEREKSNKKSLFGIFGKKAAVSPSFPSGNDSSPDLSLLPTTCPSSGPRSPLLVDSLADKTVPGCGLMDTLRKKTECKGKSCDEGESNDETSSDSSIWRPEAPVQRRFSQSSVSDGRQRMIAAEYRAKMEEAFEDLIRNRRLALTHDVASH